MLESIMLGEIPGTTIQISFYAWLWLIGLSLAGALMAFLIKRRVPGVQADYFARKALKLLHQYHLL